MTEWRPVPGYEGYEASDDGQIRSFRRYPEGRVLSQRQTQGGYPCVAVCRDGAKENKRVYQLVALAWLGPRPDGMHTRHLDGTKTNSHASNLVYGTPSENNRDQVLHGVDPWAKRNHCKNGHPLNEENVWLQWRPHADGQVGPTRRCRACWRKNTAAYAARRREARATAAA